MLSLSTTTGLKAKINPNRPKRRPSSPPHRSLPSTLLSLSTSQSPLPLLTLLTKSPLDIYTLTFGLYLLKDSSYIKQHPLYSVLLFQIESKFLNPVKDEPDNNNKEFKSKYLRNKLKDAGLHFIPPVDYGTALNLTLESLHTLSETSLLSTLSSLPPPPIPLQGPTSPLLTLLIKTLNLHTTHLSSDFLKIFTSDELPTLLRTSLYIAKGSRTESDSKYLKLKKLVELLKVNYPNLAIHSDLECYLSELDRREFIKDYVTKHDNKSEVESWVGSSKLKMYYYVKFNKNVSERVRLKFEEMVYEELKGKVEKGEEGVYDLKAILRSLEKIKSRRIMRILNENAEIIEDVGVLELKGVLENLEEEDERLIQILEEKVKTSIKKRNLHLSKSGPNYDKQNILYRSKLVKHLQSSSSILTSLNCNFSSHKLITPPTPPPQKPPNYETSEAALSSLPQKKLENYKQALSYLVKKCKSENRGRYRLKNSIKNDARFVTALDTFNGRDCEGWKESVGGGEFMDIVEVISHLSFFNLSISPNLFTSLISQLPERLTSKEADGLVKILHKCDDYRARREIIRKLGKEIKRRNGPSLHRYLSLNTKIALTHLLFLHSFSIPESRPPFLKLWNTSLAPTLNSSPLQSLNLTPENVKRLGNLNAIGKYDRVYDTVLHRGHARNYRMKSLSKEQASHCAEKVEEDHRLKISRKIFNGESVNSIRDVLDNFGVETVTSPCLDIEGYPTTSNDVTPEGFFMAPDLVSSTHGKLAVCFNDKSCFYWPNDEIRLKRARETCREKWLESLGFDVIRVEWWEWGEDEERRESMLKEKLKGVGIDVEKSWWEF